MKKLFLSIIFVLFSFFTFSQKDKAIIDSLKLRLQENLSDTLRAKIYSDLTWYYKEYSVDSALNYGAKGIDLLKKLNIQPLLAQQYSDIAGVYMIKGDTKLSEYYFKEALMLRKELKDTLGVAKISANLSAYYTQNMKLDSAMVYAIDAMEIFEDKGILNYANIVKSNVATLYQTMRNYDKALEYHFQVIEYAKEVKNDNLAGKIYNNIANVYYYSNQIDKAIEYYEIAVTYARKTENYYNLGSCLNNLTGIYFDLGDVEKGIATAKEALKYETYLNSNMQIASLNFTLGEQYFRLNRLKLAKLHLNKSLQYYDENENTQKVGQIFNFLSIIYAFENNQKLAIRSKVKSDSLLEVYFESKSNKDIKELEVKYQTEKKEKELLKTEAEKATAELNLNQQRQLTYGLFAGLALILLLGYSLFQRNKRKHAFSIAQQKEEGLQAIIQAEENERTKIARELHDGVVQQIGSVILKSRSILENLKAIDQPESKELLKSLEDSNQDLRNISHQMMPRALNELGIVASLQDLLDGSLGLVNIKSKFEHFNISERLPEKVEITIYRVVQELINNIIKHSKATEVNVQLFKTGNDAILILEDNGIGMSGTKAKKGIGLLNISSRLDMVKGQVNFEPSPQSGTLVTVKIPV